METLLCFASSQESPELVLLFSFLDIHQCICKTWTKLQPITQSSLLQIPAINNWDPAPIPAEPCGCSQPATGSCHLPPAAPRACQSQPGDTRREFNKGGKEKGKGNQKLWVQGKASVRAGMQIPTGIHVNMPGVQVARAVKSQVQDVVPGDGANPPALRAGMGTVPEPL